MKSIGGARQATMAASRGCRKKVKTKNEDKKKASEKFNTEHRDDIIDDKDIFAYRQHIATLFFWANTVGWTVNKLPLPQHAQVQKV